jgi:hypothetical protein
MNQLVTMLWDVINSPAVITAVAGGVAIILTRLFIAKPAWAAYEGTMIAAIKYAEKAIPDDVENKALRRLDTALQYVLKVFAEREKRIATPTEVAGLKESIQVVHADLEATGTLSGVAE